MDAPVAERAAVYCATVLRINAGPRRRAFDDAASGF